MLVKAEKPGKTIVADVKTFVRRSCTTYSVQGLSDDITTSEALTGLQQRPILVFRGKNYIIEGTECA
jgi:hypothetical protein